VEGSGYRSGHLPHGLSLGLPKTWDLKSQKGHQCDKNQSLTRRPSKLAPGDPTSSLDPEGPRCWAPTSELQDEQGSPWGEKRSNQKGSQQAERASPHWGFLTFSPLMPWMPGSPCREKWLWAMTGDNGAPQTPWPYMRTAI
jgi:hypothetical protein